MKSNILKKPRRYVTLLVVSLCAFLIVVLCRKGKAKLDIQRGVNDLTGETSHTSNCYITNVGTCDVRIWDIQVWSDSNFEKTHIEGRNLLQPNQFMTFEVNCTNSSSTVNIFVSYSKWMLLDKFKWKVKTDGEFAFSMIRAALKEVNMDIATRVVTIEAVE